MKTKNRVFAVIAIGAALAFSGAAQATEEEEHELQSSDVPAVVQAAAKKAAAGGKIVHWEKEGDDYEVLIAKGGKEWEYVFDARGKLKEKHAESGEKEEKEK